MSDNSSQSLFRKIVTSQWNPFANRWVTFFVSSFTILVLLLIGGISWYLYTPNSVSSERTIVIHPGNSVQAIARKLEERHIIEFPELFTLVVRFFEQAQNMKAGEYRFLPGMTPLQVMHQIAKGDTVVHQLTVAEGLMTTQVLKMISEVENLVGAVPENVKEGSLLPETYSYQYGDSRSDIIKRMQKAMQDTLKQAWESRQKDVPLASMQEALILASIIEKETGVAKERGKVAGVFVNRLRKKMRLQTDPTVIYALTQGKYVLERPLWRKDLSTQSPYNTYVNAGLPPGPIANPGKDSIIAALNPEKTDALYFVADGTGGHAFAKTLAEHNRNVAKWRKINKGKR